MSDLSGKVAFVTGASRGIGCEIFQELARMGAIVVGTATTPAGVEKIDTIIQEQKLVGAAMLLDVTYRQQIIDVMDRVVSQWGPVLILVNNAGITDDSLAVNMKDQQWDRVRTVNLDGVFWVTRAVLRGMIKKRWGRIVMVSSVLASLGHSGQVNYCAAKAGLEGMVRALARELARRSITVNAVAPGWIDTDLTNVLTPQQQDSILAHVPMGRIGDVQDIAAAVGFLASTRAAYITGITLPVNGGLYS